MRRDQVGLTRDEVGFAGLGEIKWDKWDSTGRATTARDSRAGGGVHTECSTSPCPPPPKAEGERG